MEPAEEPLDDDTQVFKSGKPRNEYEAAIDAAMQQAEKALAAVTEDLLEAQGLGNTPAGSTGLLIALARATGNQLAFHRSAQHCNNPEHLASQLQALINNILEVHDVMKLHYDNQIQQGGIQ